MTAAGSLAGAPADAPAGPPVERHWALAVAWLRTVLLLGLFGLIAAANGNGLASTIQHLLMTGGGTDWKVFVAAAGTDPFRSSGGWHWSPIAAWLFVPIVPMGLVAWQVLHVLAVGLLPTWRLRLAVLASWPFWWDVSAGNINTFIFIAAYWMLRRNQVAILVTLIIALLVPRPFELVLIAWVLVREPAWRLRFVAMVAITTVLVLVSGQAFLFADSLRVAGIDMDHWGNVAPSLFVGQAWMLVAAPLAVVVFRRGFVGVAALLANPYWLPYYLLLPLLDFAGPEVASRETVRAARRQAAPGIIGTVRDHVEDHWLLWLGLAVALGIVEGSLVGHTSALLFHGWRLWLVLLALSIAWWTVRILAAARRRSTGSAPRGPRDKLPAAPAAAMVRDALAVVRRLIEGMLQAGPASVPVAGFGVIVSLAALAVPDARVPAVVWLALTATVLAPRWVRAPVLAG